MAEIDCSNTILIVKPVGPDATASLQSEHNANCLLSFHFEDGFSSVSGYDDSKSRECTPHVSRPSELELHLQFDPGPKDATRGFVFGTDKKDCDVQLLENPDTDNRYGISRQHFRIDFNWNSGFLRLNNMSSTNGTGMTAPSVNNGFQSLKYNNMHMLHPAEQTKVQVGTLVFEMSFPARGQYQRRYDRNWEVFREKCGKAIPNMTSLNIQAELKITPFVQRRQGRRNAYLLHGEIGTGQFGMVCKASDSRTGELFAAKRFVTRKPGWDAKAYCEIAISEDVTHEHIVIFVDSIDDGGGLALVMEYMPLGNLTEVKEISLEEMKIVLRQALQALAYLHDEKNITHRDIKPENILVRSRTPEIFIKLCDFGLSTGSSFLKTHCGTSLYAAAETFTGSYTRSVDIWALGVLSFQFIKGLPATPKISDFKKGPKEWSKEWSKKIRNAVNCSNGQNDSAVALLKSMLEPNPLDRPSAKACLSHPWIQNALPSSQSGLEQANVGPRFLEAISEQPTEILDAPTQLEVQMPDPNEPRTLPKRLRSFESVTSRKTLSKRGAEKFQIDTSLETNVRGLLVKGKDKQDRENESTLSLGHVIRTQHVGFNGKMTFQSSAKGVSRVKITTGQTGRKSVSNRTRSPFKQSLPANEDLPKVSPALESLPKSLSSMEMAQMPRSNDSISEAIAKVTDFDSRHVRMAVEDQTILLRKDDCFLNATQIIKLAKKDKNERKTILDKMKEHTKVDVMKNANVKSAIRGSWVNLQHGRTLCKHLGLERQLQPLLEYAQRLKGDYIGMDIPQDQDYLVETGVHPLFVAVHAFPKPVMIRRLDWKVNSSQIVEVAGRNKSETIKIIAKYRGTRDTVQYGGSKYKGIYVDFDVAMDLCREYGLIELELQIRQVFLTEQPGEAADQMGVSYPPDSAFLPECRESKHIKPMSSPINSALGDDPLDSVQQTDPPPPPALLSYYKSCDYQPQDSQLIEVKPDLKPQGWLTTSPYQSFTDFC